MSTIRVLLADDHKIIRDGLKTLIEKEAGMEVIAEAENGRKTVRLAQKLHPNVVIMDVSMPDMNGIDATRKIMEETPGVRVIALSMHSDRRYVLGMLEAGASGYLLKDCAFEELATAIRNVAGGNTYLSPRIAEVVVKGYLDKAPGPSHGSGCRSHAARARGPAASGRGDGGEGNRLAPQRERKDRRDPPPEHDGEAQHARHRRADEIRRPGGVGEYRGVSLNPRPFEQKGP